VWNLGACNELDQLVLVTDEPFKVQEKRLEIERDKTYGPRSRRLTHSLPLVGPEDFSAS
jgi:hypothetical protein